MKLLIAALVAVLAFALYEVDRAWRLARELHVLAYVHRLTTLNSGAATEFLDALPETSIPLRLHESPGRHAGEDSVRLVGPGVVRQRQLQI